MIVCYACQCVLRISLETEINDSTTKYLWAGPRALSSYPRNVIILLDEIYIASRMEYSGGKFHSLISGTSKPTKTMLLLKSVSVRVEHQHIRTWWAFVKFPTYTQMLYTTILCKYVNLSLTLGLVSSEFVRIILL